MSPVAYYDALAITSKLSPPFQKVAVSEVHLFAYLACLLSLYRGWPASDWGYDFVATENGSPFSTEIEHIIPVLVREALIEEEDRYLSIGTDGRSEYLELGKLSENDRREEFLSGACSSVLAVPLGIIRSAVLTDHDMKLATQFGDTRKLLSEAAVSDLHNAFATLSEEIGIHVNDLMVPAVVWLNYLSRADKDGATRHLVTVSDERNQ